MKIIIGSKHFGEHFIQELRPAFPGIIFVAAYTEEEQQRAIVDADVFFGWPSRKTFLAAKQLQWIHCPGTGIDQIMSTPELVTSNVILTNARGPHTEPMADHVFYMILWLAHRGRELWEDQVAKRWETGKYEGRMISLHGRTMGIMALGGIGKAVARRAHAFGMEVYAVDAQPMQPPPAVKAVWGLDRLDDLLRLSNWFVVTAPFTAETRHAIDRRRIELMKPGASLIVVSRGGIVDEAALVDALRSGHLAGAGLDVTEVEPLPKESPLWSLENVLISPHASAMVPEMYEGRRKIFKENLRRFLAGEPLLYVCDKKAGY